MKRIKKQLILFTLAQLLVVFLANGQPMTPQKIIEDLPLAKWSGEKANTNFSDQEKRELLKMLPKGERIEFVMDYNEEDDETTYWKLSTYGLYFIDLDFDGDLDLLYSGQNGSMAQTGTKVYYNKNDVLVYIASLRDGIFDIKKNKDSYSIFTLFLPCCGSYTARIEQLKFSAIDTAVFEQSISIIGRPVSLRKGMKDFKTKDIIIIENPSLYAFPVNLKRMSAYFRKRDKEVNLEIKQQKLIELIKLSGPVEVGILGEGSFKNEAYYLVITAPLSDLPKMPESLYEWSQGDGRRLVGWVKAEGVKINKN